MITYTAKNRQHRRDLVAAAELCDQRADMHEATRPLTRGIERKMHRRCEAIWRERAARLRNCACFVKPYGRTR